MSLGPWSPFCPFSVANLTPNKEHRTRNTERRILNNLQSTVYSLKSTAYSLKSTAYSLFIILARNPAPKPLSIFTTLVPLAQLVNIPSNAESPPKLAP